MEKIQVLALNDDNHATMFALRGKCFEDAISFMNNCLVKPHSNEFEIRGIYICDENVDIDAFELVETDPKYLNEEQFNKRQRAFSALWEVADKECRYV
jgi:hypothetical protein